MATPRVERLAGPDRFLRIVRPVLHGIADRVEASTGA